MNIKARFTHEKLDHSKENETHLVVTMEAPKLDWEKRRQPICVVPVIDVSSSMAGEKIEFAKQSVIKLIDNLQPGDYCGLAAFASSLYPIAAPMEMTQSKKDELKAKAGKLESCGMTNFAGGMRQGLEWLNAADLSEKYILRVIMFTDGNANQGECWGRDLITLCKNLLGKGTLSAFGYGSDCDQELLADLAKEGKGNYTFVKNPDDALTAFARELGGLLSRYAQDISIALEPCNGHEVTEVVSDVDAEEEGKKTIVTIPEILSEEERHVVFEIKTSEQTKALPRPLNVMSVVVNYDRIEEGEKKSYTEELKAKIRFVKSGEEQKEPTKEVMELVGLAKMVQAQVEAEQRASIGDFAGAQGVMQANAAYLCSNDLQGQAEFAVRSSGLMSDSNTYGRSRGRLRSYAKGMTRGVEAGFACSDLDSLGVKSCTSAQKDMQDKFAGGSVPAASGSVVISTPVPTHTDPNAALVDSDEPEEKAKKKSKKKVSKKRSKRW
jgi:Ca-activated chloride channel family protein